jgi:hypothetical protein
MSNPCEEIKNLHFQVTSTNYWSWVQHKLSHTTAGIWTGIHLGVKKYYSNFKCLKSAFFLPINFTSEHLLPCRTQRSMYKSCHTAVRVKTWKWRSRTKLWNIHTHSFRGTQGVNKQKEAHRKTTARHTAKWMHRKT